MTEDNLRPRVLSLGAGVQCTAPPAPRKLCTRCKQVLELWAFSRHAGNTDGLQAWCRPCRVNDARKYRHENPEKMLLMFARQRARKSGLEFNLTEDDVRIPDHCPVFGIAFAHSYSTVGNGRNSPSVDRFDNLIGYRNGKVNVISHLANSAKRDLSPEQVLRLGNYILGGIADGQLSRILRETVSYDVLARMFSGCRYLLENYNDI